MNGVKSPGKKLVIDTGLREKLMRHITLVALVVALVFGAVAGTLTAQVEPGAKPSDAAPAVKPAANPLNAQQFINVLVQQVGNKDPRIRFALREALVNMSSQALPALAEAKEAHANPHVKAFVGRTIERIKKIAKREKGRFGQLGYMFANAGGRDIDRIAMDLNLNFDQMAKIDPILKKYDRDVKDLYAAMREEGGFMDKDAWKDLKDEMDLMREETRPKLEEFLTEDQTKGAMRYLQRSGFGGGIPFTFGGGLGTGSIQIIEGPGGKTGVMIKRVEKGGGEGEGK